MGSGTIEAPFRFDSSDNGAPRTCVLLGDSVTLRNHPSTTGQGSYAAAPVDPKAVDDVNTFFYYNGWFHWMNAYMGMPFEVLAYSGVSGDTYADMLARIQTDVIAFSPKYCFVQSSANGPANGLSADAEFASLQAIVSTLINANIIPIVSKLGFNINVTGAELDEWMSLSMRIMRWLRTQQVIAIDLQKGMGDTANSDVRLHADYAVDGVHPSVAGGQLMGKNGADQLNSFIPTSYISPAFNTDYQTGFLNPLNIGTNATGGTNFTGNIGDNWSSGESVSGTEAIVAAKVARTDGNMGEWTELTFSGTPTDTSESLQLSTSAVTNANSGFVTGDIVTAYVELDIATKLVNVDMPNIRWFWNSGNTTTKTFSRSGGFGDVGDVVDAAFIVKLPNVTLGTEAGTDTETLLLEFFPTAAAAWSGVLKVGRVWFEKVG